MMDSQDNHEPCLIDNPSETEAADFVRTLVKWIGPGFHPDTDFNDYVHGVTGIPIFSEIQAARLNAELEQAILALTQGLENVYDIAAPVQYALLANHLN